jgi:hypothetical protein
MAMGEGWTESELRVMGSCRSEVGLKVEVVVVVVVVIR